MKKLRGPLGRGYSRKSRSSARISVETVEPRVLLTAFFVTSTADAGTGTLRDAITMSNASTTALPNNIDFSQLQQSANGVLPINLATPLPAITEPVAILGSSGPGYDATSPSPSPTIQINGSGLGPVLQVTTNDVDIQALDLEGGIDSAVSIDSGTGNVVEGCYIGVNLKGNAAGSVLAPGIVVSGPMATIGGTTAAARNVIANVDQGIEFNSGSQGGTIEGNYIGTNAAGTVGLANRDNGITLNSGANTVANNVISSFSFGIQVLNDSGLNSITGNYIGTDLTGNKKIGNTLDGIYLDNAASTRIGVYENDTDTGLVGKGNVISGNGQNGIQVLGNSAFTTIEGNQIGVGADNTTSLGNGLNGVFLNGGGGFVTVGNADNQTTTPNELNDELGFGNTIAYNGVNSATQTPAAGVLITGGQEFDGVLSNSIYTNAGLGIQINGSNNGTLPPTITSATAGGGKTKVSGTLFERATNSPYRIQLFYTNNSAAGQGQHFIGDFNVTTDSLGRATFTDTLPTQAPVGSFLTATATQNVPIDNNSSEFSTPAQIGQAVVADLAVTVVPAFGNPATPLVGQPYVFAVTVTNNPSGASGNDAATGVVLTDTLPANSNLIAADTTAGATLSNGVLTYNIGNLADGASETFYIAVKPSSTAGTFSDTGSVTSSDIDPNLNNNTDSNTPANGVQSDATVITSVVPSSNPAPVGTPLTYVVTVSNQGPSTANSAVTTINIDPSFTNIMVSPDQGSYSVANGVITVKTGILPAGSGSTITITATPTVVGSFTTTSSVTTSVINPATGTNTSATSSAIVAVDNAADLAVTVSAPALSQSPATLLYTVTVTNNGPSTATAPDVYDTLPSPLVFDPTDSSDPGGGTITLVNGTVLAALKPIPAGGSETFTIAATYPSTSSASVTNSVIVQDPDGANPNEIDTDPTNNSASTSTLINPADLGLTITNPTDPIFIGTQAVYTIAVFNNGPSDATNVSLLDTFGPGATIVSVSSGTVTHATTGDSVTANLGTIAAGATVNYVIAVNPSASGNLTDSAAVQATQVDPDATNNSGSTTNLVNPVDLGVTLSAPTTPVVLGSPVTFTATVTNSGPATATNVIFTGSLPAGTTFVSASSGVALGSGGSTLTGNLGSLAAGASETVTITVLPSAISTIIESVSVKSDDFDTNTANDSATASATIDNPAGTIEVVSTIALAAENSGSVTLTFDRVGGSGGAVTAIYSTFDYTARAGVNYVATSGEVSFADGQTVATITVPILDDGIIDGTTGFFVGLVGTTGGASLDANSLAAVLVTNTDRDTTPPTITGIAPIPNGSSSDGFVLTFSKALDIASATNVANYDIFLSNHDAGKGADTVVPLAAAVYNPANNTVTLIPTAVLPGNRFYQIIVNGTYGNAVMDTSGNVLAGNGIAANTNYDTYYGAGTSLRYIDAQNNAVTINVSGGGSMRIYRSTDGEANLISLFGVVARKTKLTGSVKKLSKASSGHTQIGTITGLGSFGQVRSSLTTPGFYVLVPPVLTSPTTVSAESISTPAVTVGKKTVKGPRS